MRHYATVILLLAASVFPLQGLSQYRQVKSHRLREVEVTARRPLKDIGVQKTAIDSAALKENIALSMADILTYNSSIFVKSYGRATLSTVAFRGTSPSHTQVTWNGMRINNPMLGMTDFSTIPSFFVDKTLLLHGTSSVTETGGGLGGLVSLSTIPEVSDGCKIQYVQGIGSFSTFDEYLRFTYGNERWKFSTRAVYSSSPNDYTYINRDKKNNIYDEDHNIIGQYYPKERNRSGAYKDLHVLQEIYYNDLKGNQIGLNAWVINSNRELPMLTTDYGDARDFENRQRETTFRSILSWNHLRSTWRIGLRGGYIHTFMAYDYRREVSEGNWSHMTRSRSLVNTIYGQADGEYSFSRNLLLTMSASLHQHFVKSKDKNIILQDGDKAIVGYDKGRPEFSGSVSLKWQPVEPIGVSLVIREDMYGGKYSPVIPALFLDARLIRDGNVTVKGSVSRNYRFPSLNDLYFLPGGNPNLKNEHGFTYDLGLSAETGSQGKFSAGGSVNWFDSRIDDWIIWLPTTKGFFSPRNVKKVHAYGVECKADFGWAIAEKALLAFSGSYSWTPSVNRGEKMSPADRSVGKQLPYVPLHSASFTGSLTWRSWRLLYKWCYYSRRYTMSSNDYTITGHLPKYIMNNAGLEKSFMWKWADVSMKLMVNNLFNEEYLSVLSRPMPGINFEFFISFTPKFGKFGNK